MKNINKLLIGILIVFVLLYIATIIVLNNRYQSISKENTDYNHKLDSLKTEVSSSKYLVRTYEIKIDSLYKVKSQITNNYETNIQNLGNPNIVSDDSITKYIKSQISK